MRLLHPRIAPRDAAGIPRVPPVSEAEFLAQHVARRRPAVFERGAATWAAAQWTTALLVQRHGHVTVPVGRTRGGVLGSGGPRVGLEYEDMSLREGVALVEAGGDPGHYIVAPVEQRLPGLLDEAAIPRAIRDAPRLRSRLWISAAGAVSPLHRDFSDNLFAQLSGRKHITVLSPRDDRRVYEYPFFSKMPHFAAVDAENPDYRRFPRFREAKPITVDLQPGDLLYLPGRWWHQVRSVDASISINFWWAYGMTRWLTHGAEVYKRIMRIRL